MKLKNVIVVYKRGSRMADRTEHTQTLERVAEILNREKLKTKFVHRSTDFNEMKADLILTVGGDGTFLDASHLVVRRPILGLNSSPRNSVGVFCGTTASHLHETLEQIRKNQLSLVKVIRLSLRVGERKISTPVLNEILVTNANPAATARYILRWKGREQLQKSSGIWIATPVGSTAAIGGAGGKILPTRSRSFQFVVRELYQPMDRRNRIEKGIVSSGKRLMVSSKMERGRIYVDGPSLNFSFEAGEKLEIFSGAPPLKILGFNEKRRRTLWK